MCPLKVNSRPMIGAKFQFAILLIVALVLTSVSGWILSGAAASDSVKIVATKSCANSGPSHDCPARFSYAGRDYEVPSISGDAGGREVLYVNKSALARLHDSGPVDLDSNDYTQHGNAWVLYLGTVVVWLIVLLLGYAMVVRRRRGFRVSRL